MDGWMRLEVYDSTLGQSKVGIGGYEQIDGPDANLMPAGDRRPVWGWRCSALGKYLAFFLLPDPITNAP